MTDCMIQNRSASPRHLRGAIPVTVGQIRYQLILLARNPRALITGLVLPGVLLALELGRVQRLGSTPAGMAILAPRVAGLFLFSTGSIALFTHATTLVVAREDGILRRWHAAPLPPGAYFTGKIVATVLAADFAGAVLIIVSVEMAKLHVTAHAILAMLAVGTLGALSFAAAGTALTALIPTAQSAQPILMLTYLPLVFLSGAFGSIPDLPHWLATTITYLPGQPVVHSMSSALMHSGGSLMPIRDAVVLGAWLVAGILLSLTFFPWDPA